MHHARPGPRCCLVAWLIGLWLTAWPGLVQAAYSCNVVAQRVNLLAEVFAAQTVVQSLTVTCNRAPGDASTLTYRIVAGDGNHLNGAQRRVRRELTINNFLNYGLVRATAAGDAPTCSATTNWRGTGANVISGTLNFGTALSQSVTWNYCVRAAASSFANAGIYTDSVLLTLRYPNTGAGQLNTAPLDIQVGVQTSCLLDKPLPGLTVAYTSLQPMAAILNTSVLLRCSTGHPWTAGLLPDPASAAAPVTTLTNQSLLGLTYSVQVSPASGTGTGNAAGGGQAVTLGVTVPGGQAGICSMGSCTASNTHVLVITF